MTIETINAGSLPDELNAALPLFDDMKSEGDDHLRNIKIVLKNFYTLFQTYNIDSRLTFLENLVSNGLVYNSDFLDGQDGSYYRNASNLNAGILPRLRLAGDYDINITGNAATATSILGAGVSGQVGSAANADLAAIAGALGILGDSITKDDIRTWILSADLGTFPERVSGITVTPSTAWQRVLNETIFTERNGLAQLMFWLRAATQIHTDFNPGGEFSTATYYFPGVQVKVNGAVVYDSMTAREPDGYICDGAYALRTTDPIGGGYDIRWGGANQYVRCMVPGWVPLIAGNNVIEIFIRNLNRTPNGSYTTGGSGFAGNVSATKLVMLGPRVG